MGGWPRPCLDNRGKVVERFLKRTPSILIIHVDWLVSSERHGVGSKARPHVRFERGRQEEGETPRAFLLLTRLKSIHNFLYV